MKLNLSALMQGLTFLSCLALAVGAEGVADLLIH